jgi:hypothetical protein
MSGQEKSAATATVVPTANGERRVARIGSDAAGRIGVVIACTPARDPAPRNSAPILIPSDR